MIQRPPEDPRAELFERVRALLSARLGVSVLLAERDLSVERLVNYSVGSVIVLEDVDPSRLVLQVEGHPIARGTVVKLVDGRLGLRLDEVLAPRELLERLGG